MFYFIKRHYVYYAAFSKAGTAYKQKLYKNKGKLGSYL